MTTAAYNTATSNRPCAQCDFKRYFGPTVSVRAFLEGEIVPRDIELKYEGWQKLEVHRLTPHQSYWWISRNIPRLIREVGADGTRGDWGHMKNAWIKTDIASNVHCGADTWYDPEAPWDNAYSDQWARLIAWVNVRWTVDLEGDMHAHIAEFTGKRLMRLEVTDVSGAGMSRCVHQS